jgi:outer membrane receptor protein involved in Fe transport
MTANPNPVMQNSQTLRSHLLFSLALLGVLATATAQVVAPVLAPKATPVAAVQLSVFEVTAEKDLGYAAATAMTGTRTNEKLENLPNSISVMTSEFLQDIAVNDFFDAVEFATNAENTYNGNGTRGAVLGGRSGNQIVIRGMASIRQLRDGFPWYMPQDIYNTERIEVSRGPGGLAYGDVDPGGIINIATKRANWARTAATQVRYDTFGTQRYSIDLNQPLKEQGLALRVNAIHGENENPQQRQGMELRGYAGAFRWEPFKRHRTTIDVTYEHGDLHQGFSHVDLNDQTAAYIRGTGTSALDANPALAGVQANGVGRRFIAPATGALHFMTLADGVVYNLQASATAAFRHSVVVTGANVATGTDPQNPNRIPVVAVPQSMVPRYQDWGGPENGLNSVFHAHTIELKHAFSDRINLLLAYNGQQDDTTQVTTFGIGSTGTGQNNRAVFIDVNPEIPDPADPTRTRLIRNPRFEQYYVLHNPITIFDGHMIRNWRGVLVADPRLPWGITQRFVLSAGYRRESYYKDSFTRALSPEEMSRRGYSGPAAEYPNNRLNYAHYLSDGNGEAALRNPSLPGITTDYRSHDSGGADARFDQSLTSGSMSIVGSYFKGRLHSSIGLSRDHWVQSASGPERVDPATGEFKFVDTAGNLIPNRGFERIDAPLYPFSSQWATNQTYGAVWRALSWVSLSAGYFESTLFSDSFGRDLNGGALAPRNGEGHDFSLRLHPLGDRISANFTYFETVSENNSAGLAAGVAAELNPLLSQPFSNNTDYRDRTSTGCEIEIVTNLNRQWTLRATYGQNTTINTRFFPLLQAKISEARATATARRIDPDDATQLSRDYLDSQEDAATRTLRTTAALTSRYSFMEGWLKGAAVGGSVRYVKGLDRTAVSVGGVEVLPKSKTETYYIVSPFVNYRRKVGRATWTAQVNVNNAFDEVTDQSTFGVRYPRWTEPRRIITTFSVAL